MEQARADLELRVVETILEIVGDAALARTG